MSERYSSLKISAIDHLEFAVKDVNKASETYLRMGFEKALIRKTPARDLTSYLFTQNDLRIVLTQSNQAGDPINDFIQEHGEGVFSVAFLCEDAIHAFQLAQERKARPDGSPKTHTTEFGNVTEATIHTFGKVRHCFVSRKGNFFLEGFNEPLRKSNKGEGLLEIDHLAINIEAGKLASCEEFYERVFGLKKTRSYQDSSFHSQALESPDKILKITIYEPRDPKSSIQEFLDINHGSGLQHIAFSTNDMISSVSAMKSAGVEFVETPTPYFENLPQRCSNVFEALFDLEKLQILADGDNDGYLLQIFTKSACGPFGYEIIQRKNHEGFGEGNYKAQPKALEQNRTRQGFY